jgi:hypothetical protein
MQTVSLIWGILALVSMLVALTPCLGALNWLVVPFAGLGLVFCVVVFAIDRAQNKAGSIAGIIACAVAMVIGFLRLIIGLGVF